jgi:hypothetical protein
MRRPLVALAAAAILLLPACVHRHREVVVYEYEPGTVEAVPPPPGPAVVEPQPLCPGPTYVWVPGYYSWHAGAYVWVSGRWEVPPRGAVWVPGHWVPRRRGYIWIPGHFR